jgi:hypothetical protein
LTFEKIQGFEAERARADERWTGGWDGRDGRRKESVRSGRRESTPEKRTSFVKRAREKRGGRAEEEEEEEEEGRKLLMFGEEISPAFKKRKREEEGGSARAKPGPVRSSGRPRN